MYKLVYFFIFCTAFYVSSVDSISKKPILIIVSYDAFRYNYFAKNATPNMERLSKKGTTAEYIKNVFPTKTYPNHQTISTGLFVENHGVTGNELYDPLLNKTVSMSYEMYHYSEDVLPIWIVNQKEGGGRHSGCMMWPGGIFEYQKTKPTFVQNWDPDIAWEKRIDTVISWILHESTPANLIMLYFEEPDTHGHAFGPNSNVVFNMLQKLDNTTQYLEDQLIKYRLQDKVNVIHLSDHGMDSVSPPNFINITQFLDSNSYSIVETSPTLHIIPKEGREDEIYGILKNVSLVNKHFKVYKRSELLDRWHYKNNRRTPPILAVADLGYGFQDLYNTAKEYEIKYNITVTDKTEFGIHGYDNEIATMHPYFMARGPRIKSNYKIDPFESIDFYSLFCSILEIKPRQHNGTFGRVADMLLPKQQPKDNVVSPILFAVLGGILSLFALGCVGTLVVWLMKCKQDHEGVPLQQRRYASHLHDRLGNIESQQLLFSDSEET